jgi:hypothetical protein
MRRRTRVIGITSLMLTGCAAVAASAASATAASTTGASTTGASAASSVKSVPAMVTGSGGMVARRVIASPVVLGMFEEQGGPVRPGSAGGAQARALSGVVTFKNSKGHTTNVAAGSNGHFTARIPAGTYTVTARSPQIEQQNPNGTRSDPPCAGPKTVVVRPKQPTSLTLVCYVP